MKNLKKFGKKELTQVMKKKTTRMKLMHRLKILKIKKKA